MFSGQQLLYSHSLFYFRSVLHKILTHPQEIFFCFLVCLSSFIYSGTKSKLHCPFKRFVTKPRGRDGAHNDNDRNSIVDKTIFKLFEPYWSIVYLIKTVIVNSYFLSKTLKEREERWKDPKKSDALHWSRRKDSKTLFLEGR